MNAVAKPRTVKQLRIQIEGLESAAVEAETAYNAAKSAQARLVVRGSEQEIAAGSRKVQEAKRLLSAAVDDLATAREALEIAKAGEQQDSAQESERQLQALLSELTKEAAAIEKAVETLGQRLPKLIAANDAVELALVSLGVTPDPWAFRAKYTRVIELGLWLSSEGKFGVMPAVDSKHQLKQSGQASITRLAAEYKTVLLRRVRSALGITET